jgi:hypothetical protein
MISFKANKQTEPKTVARPKSSPGEGPVLSRTVLSQDAIRSRAYELYENRGCGHGQDERDWLRAEQEIRKLKR